ncbi:hypothetical protein H2201_005604 [Coniosporium apollinis]|uniref:MYND-type domain-containing protein n=1 Tax=Coniosporium apollinis TaxID=61459 RepID=A0ABQ9NP87_9PEZI|nr:hypothetical protein H2201_005604 [Coniosporium apollinis]
MADTNAAVATCASCARPESGPDEKLKRCAKCQTTQYCSRECQKADWKTHKKVCVSNAAAAAASSTTSSATSNNPSSSAANSSTPPKGLLAAVDKPFHRLEAQTWLHDRPEQDVYQLLIDTYRFRMEDHYNLEGEADRDSIYGGARDGRQGFRRFLSRAQSKRGLLPPWWSPEKAAECEAMGMRRSEWTSLASAIEKSDVIEHYGNPQMPMQLRMFGEQIYGRGPGGQDGTEMRKLMMMAEAGGAEMMFGRVRARRALPCKAILA